MSDDKSKVLNGSIFLNLLYFTIPVILTGVLQLLYNAADIIVVGRVVGSQSLAAVGSTSSITHLFVNLFIGLSAGTSVCVARYIGEQDKESIEKTVHTSIMVAIIGGVFLAIVGIMLSRTVLEMMQTPADILDEASLYMKIIFLGMPANMVYNFGAAILRAEGNTKTPLIYLAISGLINVGLNIIFVVFFKMKADGVAWATIISQVISAALVILYLMKSSTNCRFYIKKLKIHSKMLLGIIKIGVPAGLQGMIFSISNVLIQSSINTFGSVVVAGNSASGNLEGFAYTAMNATHQSMLTFVGQHIGAKKISRIKKVISLGCLQVFIIGVVSSGLLLLFARPLLSLYAPGKEAVINSGINRLIVIVSPYFLCGLMETIVGATRGMGESLKPMIVSILGVCGIRILWIFTIFKIYQTPFSLYISYPISWLITALLQLIFCVNTYKKIKSEYNIY